MRPLIVVLLLVAAPLWAQDPPAPPTPLPVPPTPAPLVEAPYVDLPDTFTVPANTPVILKVKTNCVAVEWNVPAGLTRFNIADLVQAPSPTANETFISFAAPGVYSLGVYGCRDNKLTKTDYCTITVGDPPPPVPPTPPTPPVPPPSADPFSPAEVGAPLGFRFIIIRESADDWRLSPAQAAIANSTELYDFAKAKCVKDAAGNPDFRSWDKDVNTANASPLWQKVMQRPRQSLPWIVVGNGRSGFEGPLPSDLNATLELLRKYAG